MISTKCRYALRVMLDLAMQDPERYIPLKEIASRQELSEKYLEIILKTLVKQNLANGIVFRCACQLISAAFSTHTP